MRNWGRGKVWAGGGTDRGFSSEGNGSATGQGDFVTLLSGCGIILFTSRAAEEIGIELCSLFRGRANVGTGVVV